MRLTRHSKLGQVYFLDTICGKENANKTKITFGIKSIIVDVPLETMSQGWYDWQMKGMFIQDAFPMLSDAEREFLMTGITDSEWKEIFKDSEETDDTTRSDSDKR